MSKKNFMAFAVVTAVLAGCQTTQKQYTAEEIDVPGYGADRVPASNPGDGIKSLIRVEESLRGVKVGAKAVAGAEVPRFYQWLNSQPKTPAMEAALKGTGRKITSENVDLIPAAEQARLASAFLKQSRYKDMPALSSLREQVNADVARVGNSKFAEAKTGLLSTGTGFGQSGTNATVKKPSIKLSDLLDQIKASDPSLSTAEGTAAIRELGVEVAAQYKNTGISFITPNTCKEMGGLEGVRSYTKMVRMMNKEVAGMSKAEGAVACARSLDAFAAVNFQGELGRSIPQGVAARAVQEMASPCDYIPEEIGQAVKALPEGNRRPACK
ncbi:MAG: hypothetical protein H7301_12670 [Cryobacterium sp.]|nr:hypothetical protein [Oligoflexia bacterium]